MKLGKMLTEIGAVVCTSLIGTALSVLPAFAQSSRPYVVFVNGQGNCCAWSMDSLDERLKSQYGLTGNDFRFVPYSNFRDGGQSGGGNQLDWSSVDSQFLKDGEDFINNQLDRNRPLILIGHSFGGDSVLKLLPRINRRVQFVAVIDPVRTGGLRVSLKALNVPSNVDYFFNRWQENVPFPNDFGTNGSIPCNAKQCDQDSQNIARNADFSPRTTKCRWDEVTCPGFVAPNPFIGRRGRPGTKQVRVGHQDLPKDAFIQKDLGNKIQRLLASIGSASVESSTLASGYYRRSDRPEVYFVNAGSRTACHVQNPSQMEVYGGFGQVKVVQGDGFRSGTQFTRSCLCPDGLYRSREKPEVYYLHNNWKSACWVRTSERVDQLGGWGRVRLIDSTSRESLTVGRSYSDRC